ncbi:MAG: hypothetical protein CME62_16620 [Halobacteriovoraceae bacterium]|nr:hypothetical protein [Halobacteriovoraceae bacterium]|tara:strand:+ start:10645 stop:11154 length:510 start_codon:yes stop_codon:yes gene_type:complete
MSELQTVELKLKLSELVMLWRNFCETHTQLYEYTCDEYIHLLASDIENLNETVSSKLTLLENINTLDAQRQELTHEITGLLGIENHKKLSHLTSALKANGETDTATQIEKLNLILIDIIEKVQEQNKKNQVFLNKAILSLQDLRESFMGKSNYKTYSASGVAKNNSTFR